MGCNWCLVSSNISVRLMIISTKQSPKVKEITLLNLISSSSGFILVPILWHHGVAAGIGLSRSVFWNHLVVVVAVVANYSTQTDNSCIFATLSTLRSKKSENSIENVLSKSSSIRPKQRVHLERKSMGCYIVNAGVVHDTASSATNSKSTGN